MWFTGIINGVRAEEMVTWQDCSREAKKNHPDLISAEEEVKELKASKKITASAIFPQIDTNASGFTAKTVTTTSGTADSKTSDTYTYAYLRTA